MAVPPSSWHSYKCRTHLQQFSVCNSTLHSEPYTWFALRFLPYSSTSLCPFHVAYGSVVVRSHFYTGAAVDNKRNNTHCQWLRNYASSVVAHYDCVDSNHTQTPNYDYFRTACQWFYAVG